MSDRQLLACCTQLDPCAQETRKVAQLAHEVRDWTSFVAQAERHGVAPLVYRHLRAAQVGLPDEAVRALQGLYLAHRHANMVRTQTLTQVLRELDAVGIEALVVKGGALCHLLYPEPALRPMSDLDLLLRRSDIEPARCVLRALGMSAPLPPGGQADKSLPTAGAIVDGVWVGIELHYDLFEASFGAAMTWDDLTAPPTAFALGEGGPTARTLGLPDLLWHLCEHLRFHAAVFTLWRLVWVADILGIVERFGGELDWGEMAQRYPGVLRTLSLLCLLRPLAPGAAPPALDAYLANKDRAPRGIGQDFDGWPRHALADQREKGLARILADTLWPPEWWLRLRHGLGANDPFGRVRWSEHPREMLGWLRHYLRSRSATRVPRRIDSKGARHDPWPQ